MSEEFVTSYLAQAPLSNVQFGGGEAFRVHVKLFKDKASQLHFLHFPRSSVGTSLSCSLP